MIKFISSEDYYKLTGNIDYWNCQALEQERLHKLYKRQAISLSEENRVLKQKIKELEQKEEVFEDFENFGEEDFYNLLVNIVKDIKKFPQIPIFAYWKNKLSKKGYKIRINKMDDLFFNCYIWSIEKEYNTIVEYRDFVYNNKKT